MSNLILLKIMMFKKEIEALNIAFDYSKEYTIARVPHNYANAEEMAIELVYSLKPYVAHKLNIEDSKVIIVAISKNNKVVVLCDDSRSRDYLWTVFKRPSIGSAQFYDTVPPEQIIAKMDELFE